MDTDTIACESCGARLLFSTPSSWTQQQGMSYSFIMTVTIKTKLCNFFIQLLVYFYLNWTVSYILSVEKAALVFSLKLDNGHKLLCPWIDNICDETLAQFPPMPPPVLVEKFRERSSALIQLLALPVISPSAIEYMRSTQLEEFLKWFPILECGNEAAKGSETDSLRNQCQDNSVNLYYQV